ncbi:hypothetical protein KCU83_g601, partial [Aureobasidium melanogenum]
MVAQRSPFLEGLRENGDFLGCVIECSSGLFGMLRCCLLILSFCGLVEQWHLRDIKSLGEFVGQSSFGRPVLCCHVVGHSAQNCDKGLESDRLLLDILGILAAVSYMHCRLCGYASGVSHIGALRGTVAAKRIRQRRQASTSRSTRLVREKVPENSLRLVVRHTNTSASFVPSLTTLSYPPHPTPALVISLQSQFHRT